MPQRSSNDKKTSWFSANSGTLAAAVVAALIAAAVSLSVQHSQSEQTLADKALDASIDKRLSVLGISGLVGDVREMKGKLDQLTPLVQTLAEREMKQTSLLQPDQFREALPTLAVALTAAKATGVTQDVALTADLKQRLLATGTETPYFWRSAAALIDYDLGGKEEPNRPACVNPELLNWVPLPGQSGPFQALPSQYIFRNCTLDLGKQLAQLSGGSQQFTVVCDHCRVVYAGGSSPLLNDKRLVSLILQQCLFDVGTSEALPDYGRRFLLALVSTSNPERLELPAAG